MFFASSTKMTGLPILRGFLLQTLTAYAPASPAPMTITGMASPRLPEMRSFEHTRQIIRLPPTAIVAISAIRISTPRKAQRQELVQRQRHAAGNRAQQAQPRHIAHARIAPHDLINAAQHIAGHVHHDHHRHGGVHRLHVPRRNVHLKSQLHAQIYGKHNQHDIQQRHACFSEPCVVFQLVHRLSLSN